MQNVITAYLKSLIDRSPSKLITYGEFIEAVLYHPEFGYYMKKKQKIGRDGDFITTSNISDLFGRMIAKWVSHLIHHHQLDPVFCEVGAGNGRFAKAFLEEWAESVRKPLQYIIVESSPYHRKLQRELVEPYFTITQVASIKEIPPFAGVIFSNELFDALPVDVIEKEDGKIHEVRIGMKDGLLYEQKIPLSNSEILAFLNESPLKLGEKQRMEIPVSMEKMVAAFAETLIKGFVVTVDYGYSNDEWMEAARKNGSLRGYYQHQLVEDVLLHPSEMDITSHIHFDWLQQKGEERQLNFVAKFRQDEFLLKAGILKELENHYDPNPFSAVSKRNRAIRSLITSGGMSAFFQVLIQQKELFLDEEDLFEN